MNFYKRFPGDIQAKTRHLTPAEFGIYDRLLDHYYSTEQPLPSELLRCCSIAGCLTKTDRDALMRVLAEYFIKGDDGLYRQRRTDEMIAEAQPKIAAARENGKHGGRPRKSKNGTQSVPDKNPVGSETETQKPEKRKASQNQSSSLCSEQPPPLSGVQGEKPPKPSKRCPADFVVTVELRAEATADSPGVDIDRETRRFRDWTFTNPRVDWPATWRNWMREASDRKRGNGAQQSFREIDAANAAEKVRQWTGGILDEKREENRGEIFDLEAPNAPRIASR